MAGIFDINPHLTLRDFVTPVLTMTYRIKIKAVSKRYTVK